MTHQDYTSKKNRMVEISKNPYATDSENKEMIDLIMDVALYEANNGMIKENEFKDSE